MLAKAMDVLARDIQSDDGIANAAIAEAAERLRELRHENNVLCDFINREMQMTAADPRIAELEKRIAAMPNEKLSNGGCVEKP